MSENPLLGVLIGTVFTVAVQSSSAAIGLLQTLFGQGLMELDAALPVLFGDNIGTTITAVFFMSQICATLCEIVMNFRLKGDEKKTSILFVCYNIKYYKSGGRG